MNLTITLTISITLVLSITLAVYKISSFFKNFESGNTYPITGLYVFHALNIPERPFGYLRISLENGEYKYRGEAYGRNACKAATWDCNMILHISTSSATICGESYIINDSCIVNITLTGNIQISGNTIKGTLTDTIINSDEDAREFTFIAHKIL